MMNHDAGGLLVGGSPLIGRVRELIARVAPTNLPVLIQGETEVGKELVAQAIHLASGHPGALVAFNVCALSDSMFEDALFGHVRGAFTGASGETRGYLGERRRSMRGDLDTVGQTRLLVRDGQTAVLGGLADRQRDANQSGIPVLSSIPLIGGCSDAPAVGRRRRSSFCS